MCNPGGLSAGGAEGISGFLGQCLCILWCVTICRCMQCTHHDSNCVNFRASVSFFLFLLVFLSFFLITRIEYVHGFPKFGM